jgi:ABC-type Fe3+/spermidine/putrescine transport system ATPase subunit
MRVASGVTPVLSESRVPGSPGLRVVGLSKAFETVPAVDDVTLEVRSESFFSLLGPSGCGKTTLLRMIAGLVIPDRGDIYIREELANRKPPYRRDTAMVFQNYALFPHMSVFDNVAFGLRYRRIGSRDRATRVRQVLDLVGLAAHGGRYPSQLSGGQQQRVALARAIVTRPALLLLDEPLSNLDLQLRQQMRYELRSIQRDVKITTIYVTHDQAEAFAMSDRIAVMNEGRILQIGSPEDIFLRPNSEFVVTFIGETNSVSCVVVGHEFDQVLVRSDDDLVFCVETPAGEGSRHPKGAKRNLFFRHEQARLATTPSLANSFPAIVDSIQNLGSMRSYTVELRTGRTIRATIAATRAATFDVDARVFLEVDPADCILVSN